MGLFTHLARFFGGPGAGARPMPPPAPHTRRTPRHISDAVKLEVSKAIEQLAFVDRSLSLGLWPSEASKQDWKHDLSVMRAFDDLEHVRLEVLAADQRVLCEFRLAFNGSAGGPRRIDSGRGVEIPLIARRLIAGQRVIIERRGREAQYKDLLKIRWSPAETLRKQDGDTFESEHTHAITGGRQHGEVYVDPAARHRLIVTQTGTKGYAFAKDLDLGVDGVFLLPKFAPAGLQFYPGQQLTAVVVQVPRGFQARNIQAA